MLDNHQGSQTAISQTSNDISNRLHNRIVRESRVINLPANLIELVPRRGNLRELIARHADLDKRTRLRRDLVPPGAGGGVLDPLDEPAVDGVGESLLLRRHVGEAGEALVAAVEERNLSAVRGRRVGRADDVVVGAEEPVGPRVLLSAAHVGQVVHGADEPGVAVLGAAAEGVAGKVEAGVSVDERAVGDVGDVGVEGVDPGAEVGVLGALDDAEDGAFAVGGAG
jgi:hypothetical protein